MTHKLNLKNRAIRRYQQDGFRTLCSNTYKRTKKLWRKHIFSKGPANVCIELTNACNLHCYKCDAEKTRMEGGEIRFISPAFFKELIDQLAEIHADVSLNFGGESLLHQQFKELLAYASEAKQRGLGQISWFDNGTLFDRDTSETVVKLGVDLVYFSIDKLGSANDEWCKGSNYAIVEKNIRQLLTIRDASKKPRVFINKVDVESPAQTWLFLKHWLKIVDAVQVSTLHDPKFVVFNREKYFAAAPTYTLPYCTMPFNSMGILADGRVAACMGDDCAANLMGNAKTIPIKEIWKSERYRQFREAIKKRSYPDGSPCVKCDCWKTQFVPATDELGEGIEVLYGDTKIYRLSGEKT